MLPDFTFCLNVLKKLFLESFLFESWHEGILSEGLFLNVRHWVIAVDNSRLVIPGAC